MPELSRQEVQTLLAGTLSPTGSQFLGIITAAVAAADAAILIVDGEGDHADLVRVVDMYRKLREGYAHE